MKRVIVSLSLGVLLLLGLVGCKNEKSEEIRVTGNVEMTEVVVRSKFGGKITEVLVEEGQTVKANALLAKFDDQDIAKQLEAAKANLDVAKARYQKSSTALNLAGSKVVNPTRQTQIDLAQHNLKIAKATLEGLQAEFQRLKQLYEAEQIPKAQFDQIATKLEVAKGQYQAAQSQLNLARLSPNTEDIELVSRQSGAQIKQAESTLNTLDHQLQDAQLSAPLNGYVAARLVEPGEFVTPGMTLFTIRDYQRPWVKVYLTLLELEKISLNQKVTVQLDAFPNEKFVGRVASIASEAEFTPKNYQSKEERVKQVYAVKVMLDNSKERFKTGIPVEVIFTPQVGKGSGE